ncbi:hypothetical protein ARUE_c17610 [Arthrobacter sp. Rue61a]|nr:hypothetical protein ARUE_c17610 [Arthrobacter sp. Rue61a]
MLLTPKSLEVFEWVIPSWASASRDYKDRNCGRLLGDSVDAMIGGDLG